VKEAVTLVAGGMLLVAVAYILIVLTIIVFGG
jgi:hypothetical protein